MLRTPVRVLATTLLSLATLLALATPALAHTSLVGSDPAEGATVTAAPEVITLTFTDPMEAEFSTVTITGPDGTDAAGNLRSDGAAVAVTVAPLTASGRYEIGYRVLSQDGHPVTGTLAFTLDLPPAATGVPEPSTAPTAAAAPPPASAGAAQGGATDGGTPAWPWLVAALVLVGGGVGAALRLGRGQ
jgi:copper resistance protein C